MRVAALIGEPATGKSTVAKSIISTLGPGFEITKGLLKRTVYNNTHVLGLYPEGEKFGGTDRLSMAVQPYAEIFIKGLKACGNDLSTVFFEGDRLGNLKFLNFVKEHARLRVFVLTADEELKKQRHIDRGDTQSETFLKGRKTKIENILKAFPYARVLENKNRTDMNRAHREILNFLKGGE